MKPRHPPALQHLPNRDFCLVRTMILQLWRVPPVKGPHTPKTSRLTGLTSQAAEPKNHVVPGLSGEFRNPSRSRSPPTLREVMNVLRPTRSCVRWAGSSGFLGAGGENHGGGEPVNAQSRDVDLITAVSGKLKRDTETCDIKAALLLVFLSHFILQMCHFQTTEASAENTGHVRCNVSGYLGGLMTWTTVYTSTGFLKLLMKMLLDKKIM